MTYNVWSGTLNTTIPYHTCHLITQIVSSMLGYIWCWRNLVWMRQVQGAMKLESGF